METYCIYLRKSRADADAEARGEGETFARHQKILQELAKRRALKIVAEYREIVSGDNIASRPQMQAMLAEITAGKYTGVLCMEVERLARGNTIDQGIVAQAFKNSGTLIITPVKTYDPNNEFDEEYFEFSLFMSRREYKTIRRRMQAGRLASVKDGCYISPDAPYGYQKIHPEPKIHTLEMIPEEAETVRLIYNLYMQGKGVRAITTELNQRGILPRKSPCWEIPSVRKILKNPVYAGFLHWHTKKEKDKNICYTGLHPAIIEPALFQAVQEKRLTSPAVPLPEKKEFYNYYHNILFCGVCGHQMGRRFVKQTGKAYILCRYKQCAGKTVSTSMQSIDEALLSAFYYRIQELQAIVYQSDSVKKSETKNYCRKLEQELERLTKQKSKLYDFLEQEIYDTDTFLERMQKLNQKRKSVQERLMQYRTEQTASGYTPQDSILSLQYVLNNFHKANAADKNKMLCAVIKHVDYYKTKRNCCRQSATNLNLYITFI